MSFLNKTISFAKGLLYGAKGEPFIVNRKKLYFQEGSRPTRGKYLNSNNVVNRNELLEYNYLLKNLKMDSVFWDIGAHYGTMSLLASANIDYPNCIFAFEPDASARVVLNRNISYNNLKEKISVLSFAAASYDGFIEFNIQDGNSNSHINNSSNIDDRGKLKSLECFTFNTMLSKIKKPDLIKIDAEGAELDIIKGASDLLKDHSIHFICELHPFAWEWYEDAKWSEFVHNISKSGRRIKVLDPLKKESDLPFYGSIVF